MHNPTRRQLLQTAAATTAAATGLYFVPGSAKADLSITNFTAFDDYILTRDGSVSAVWADPTIELEWVGLHEGADLEAVIRVTNVDSDGSDTLVELHETLAATNGSATFALNQADVTSVDSFETADFEVEESGAIRETEIEFEVTVTVQADNETYISDTRADVATITVERLPGPTIDTFELEDDSNPAHTRVDVTWAISDEHADLEEVTSELRFADSDQLLDSVTTQVGGTEASGDHYLQVQETSDDNYEVTLLATNVDGNATVETKLDTGEYVDDDPKEPDDPEDGGFSVLTAEVTETDTHGHANEYPTQVTFYYEFEAEHGETVEFTVEVSNTTETVTDTGNSETVVVDINPGGQPGDTATVTVTKEDGEQYIEEISADDGEVDLLN